MKHLWTKLFLSSLLVLISCCRVQVSTGPLTTDKVLKLLGDAKELLSDPYSDVDDIILQGITKIQKLESEIIEFGFEENNLKQIGDQLDVLHLTLLPRSDDYRVEQAIDKLASLKTRLVQSKFAIDDKSVPKEDMNVVYVKTSVNSIRDLVDSMALIGPNGRKQEKLKDKLDSLSYYLKNLE